MPKIPSKLKFSVAVLAFASVNAASAVTLSERGLGQVLLFPYYTVNANNNTLISIVNTSASGKAMRVRFAEGENGRDAYSLNVYLDQYDVWTAAIFDASSFVSANSATGPAGLVTDDSSCTVPSIRAPQPHVLPDGRGFVPFSNAAFSAANADPGTSDLSRTSEGSIEVIEMGSYAVYPFAHNCAAIVQAWAPGGYWSENPTGGISNPTGGVYGVGYIVNVERGTIFSYDATALGDFRSDPRDRPRGSTQAVVLHTAPGDAHPALSDALNDPVQNLAVAHVQTGEGTITATYRAPEQAVDAVSAVLMASALSNDFSFSSDEGATTNYILGYPTRRFYTDPAIVGSTAIAPFTQLFAGIQHDIETESVPMVARTREGYTRPFPCGTSGCDLSVFLPGTSVELLNFGAGANALLGSALAGRLGLEFGSFVNGVPEYFVTEGWTGLYFDGSTFAYFGGATYDTIAPVRFMRPSIEGERFAGLPVVGFAAQNLVNGNVRDGILANYSSAVPHRVLVNCYLPVFGSLQPGPCE